MRELFKSGVPLNLSLYLLLLYLHPKRFIGQLGTSIGRLILFTLTSPVPLPLQTMALPTSYLVLYVFQVFLYSSLSDCLLHAVLLRFAMRLSGWLPFSNRSKSEGFTITDSSRVKRLHSDRAGEFTAPCFERFLTNHKSIYHTVTSGYDPQANGAAERAVGLVKSLAARALATAQLDCSYWSYSVRHAAQSLLCHALQRHQRSLPFGSSVLAQELDHKKFKFPDSRTVTGRLLFTCKTKCHTFSFHREMTILISWFTARAFLHICLLQSRLMS